MGKNIAVILNSRAGTAGGEDLEQAIQTSFEKHAVKPSIYRVRTGEQFESVIKTAAASDCDVLVGAGGDGTISAVAAAAAEAGKILGVLPLGTLNHFSKDLGIPQDLDGAISVITHGFEKNIDLAEVNGRTFINNSSIGLYPRLVRGRERGQRLGYGKWWAAAWALMRLPRWSPFQTVKLDLEGNELIRKTPFVFVGNNIYEMDLYRIGTRQRLDEGTLCIYLLRRSGRTGLVLLILRTIFGGLTNSDNFEEFHATRVTIETRRRRSLVAMDGEVAAMESPLEYKIHPRRLRVLAPAAEA